MVNIGRRTLVNPRRRLTSMSILMLWQASLGMPIPQRIDTGTDLITPENVDAFLARTKPQPA